MNQPKSHLWYIFNKAYDLSPFVPTHPGGDAILMGQGMNCTELFMSWHVLHQPSLKMIEKYALSDQDLDVIDRDTIIDAPTPVALKSVTPRNTNSLFVAESIYYTERLKRAPNVEFTFGDSDFYVVLKKRVSKYFLDKKIGIQCPPFYQVLTWLNLIAILVLFHFSYVRGSIISTILLGISRGIFANGALHAAFHYSVFKNANLNLWFAKFGCLVGVSTPMMWMYNHNVNHHLTLWRQVEFQSQSAQNKWRSYYVWFEYMIHIFIQDWETLDENWKSFTTGIYPSGVKVDDIWPISQSLLFLYGNFIITRLGPFLFLPFWTAMIIMLINVIVTSIIIRFTLVLNHKAKSIIDECLTRRIKDLEKSKEWSGANGVVLQDWGEHQTYATAGYEVESFLWLVFSGGASLHTEHHLFPSMHYVHFMDIAPIVRETCKEFKIPYLVNGSFLEALHDHYLSFTHPFKVK